MSIQKFFKQLRVVFFVVCCFSFLLFNLVSASAAESQQKTKTFQVYISKPFRIWYSVSKFNSRVFKDENKNLVPDRIEDMAIQLQTARYFFHTVYDFADPLRSDRHALHPPTYIDVFVLPRSKLPNKYHGVSSVESIQAYNSPKGVYALRMKLIENTNPLRSSTLIHEYFHLIQYGTTYFRNDWFLEGLADWSRDLVADFKDSYVRTDLLNALRETPNEVFDQYMSYNAADLVWRPFVAHCGERGKLSDRLFKKFKYVDGSSVLKDAYVYGARTIPKVLRCLKDSEQSASESFENYIDWVKKGQNATTNTQYIKKCIEEHLISCELNTAFKP